MSWGVANPWMLLGLIGVAIPVVVHLLNRRRAVVVDWGAMQFLEIGRRARRKLQLTDLLLMAGRMLLLGLVALALARPFWTPRPAAAGDGAGAGTGGAGAARRDVVLILDGSDSMALRAGGSTPRDRAIAWARAFVGRLGPGSTVGLLVARDQVEPLVDPPTHDRERVDRALGAAPPARGSSDLPAAVAEALRLLEGAENPSRDIVVLTDGQALPWRADESGRWGLLRALHAESARRTGVAPRLWSVAFDSGAPPEGADGSVGPLELPRGLVPPLLPLTVRTTVANAGPGELTRTAELLVDGTPVPGTAQVVGPIPPGGTMPLEFRTTITEPGAHALAVRLAPGEDPLAANDESARPVQVVRALPVLLVDGEPGLEPLSGEVDYLRAALAPTGDDTPQVAATVVTVADFTPGSLDGQRVVVLANVTRLDATRQAALAAFLGRGGGVLVVPGDQVDADEINGTLARDGAGWLPATLGAWRGDPAGRVAVAHPAPPSFAGASLAPFARGEDPPLGDADLFAYRVLTPATRAPAAAVLARLDTGDPWIVERPHRDGRAILLAGPLDAEGGTLPVNPDFVPLVHELVFHLADPAPAARAVRPGEPVAVDLGTVALPEGVTTLAVATPSGATREAAVTRAGGRIRARLEAAAEPGLYRFDLPEPPGGAAYVAVAADPREWDPAPLSPAAAEALAAGWPLTFDDPAALPGRLFAAPGAAGPHPLWRLLVLAALSGLCLEVYLTRRVVRRRGLADVGADG